MINPDLYTPQYVKDELLRYGGKNVHGRPLWRLVQAEKRTVIRGGVFHDFGDRMPDQTGFAPDGRFAHQQVKPVSTHVGMAECRLYPKTKGWILEHWFPPQMFGTKEWWTSQKGEGGYPLLGPYPAEGDYWMLSGPWPAIPSLEELRHKIRGYEYAMDQNAGDPTARINAFVAECEQAKEKEWDEWENQRQYAIKHIVRPLMNTVSLTAQRERQRVLERWGIRSFIPAGGNL